MTQISRMARIGFWETDVFISQCFIRAICDIRVVRDSRQKTDAFPKVTKHGAIPFHSVAFFSFPKHFFAYLCGLISQFLRLKSEIEKRFRRKLPKTPNCPNLDSQDSRIPLIEGRNHANLYNPANQGSDKIAVLGKKRPKQIVQAASAAGRFGQKPPKTLLTLDLQFVPRKSYFVLRNVRNHSHCHSEIRPVERRLAGLGA
jgi:hypothetical protein